MTSTKFALVYGIMIVLIAVMAYASSAASGESVSSCSVVTNGLQFCISLSNSQYSPLEPIVMDLVVSNSSEKALAVVAGRPEWLCDIRVIHKGVGEVAKSRYGMNASESTWRANFKPIGIEAGACRNDPLLLNRYFDMSVAGTYQVSVKRRLSMPGSGKATVAESGEVEIHVTAEVPGATSAWGGEQLNASEIQKSVP